MTSLLQLSMLKLIDNMAKCEYDFSDTRPELVQALQKYGNTNPMDILDSIRADVGSLRNLGGKAQSVKHLLVVDVEGKIEYYWYQIHTEYVMGAPNRYSPYPRPNLEFKWVLNVIEATNENCNTKLFANKVCGAQTSIPQQLDRILLGNCPHGFMMACRNAPHRILRTRR